MKDAVYLALDFPDWKTTSSFLRNNDLKGVPVKVGMELFYREGPKVIARLKEDGHRIFLDLKLHDIPTTVGKAMQNIAALGTDIVTVHALGGGEMIKRAKEGFMQRARSDAKLIAVTILTSMDHQTLNSELRILGSVTDEAAHLAQMAKHHGADGVVCAVSEAKTIKSICSNDFLTVTPGIRLAGSQFNDQKRVATPADAIQQGADILVVGRSVTLADDPNKAYHTVLEEVKHASK